MADLTTVIRIYGTCVYRDDIADRSALAGYTRRLMFTDKWETVLRDADGGEQQHSTHYTRAAADDALLEALEVPDA